VAIHFDEAILIACLGLAVNIVCAFILRDRSEDPHDHTAAHAHRDHNLSAAYLHVLADAFTSILAIAALLAGWLFDLVWMDPAIGIVGALVIGHWSIGLVRSSGAVLLDAAVDPRLVDEIRTRLEVGSDRLTDLHVWRVGPGHVAVIAAIASERPEPAARYKSRLEGIAGMSHVTIEVQAQPRA
jgi:cation diffusion facilitator family transporter